MKIHFWGATEGVTGSKTFLHLPEGLALIDCGVFQGMKEEEEKNLLPLPYPPYEISAVIITHAHLDHTGYLPRLVGKGFRGKIYCTSATAKLMRIILEDSLSLNEEGFFDENDVTQTLNQIKTVDWQEHFSFLGASAKLIPAGHILGASSVLLNVYGKKIVFSGDLGRKNDPLIPSPQPCPEADVVVMESTYGGKSRHGDIRKELLSFIVDVARNSKIGIIASFAVARAQLLITVIEEFYRLHPQEKLELFVDSPMMKEANAVYKQYSHLTLQPEAVKEAMREITSLDYQRMWDSLKKKNGPLLIISSSGMLNGGRILRHLSNWKDKTNAVLFLPGHQAEGTLGHSFAEGHRSFTDQAGNEAYWMGEVIHSEAFSSHADQDELVGWLENVKHDAKIFLIHGETNSKKELMQELHLKGFKFVSAPAPGETIEL